MKLPIWSTNARPSVRARSLIKPHDSIGILVVILIASFFSFSCGKQKTDSTELRKISIRLPIPVIDVAFSPYYIAIDSGLFKKEGLEVSIRPGTPELNPVKMVSQGIDEFGILGGPELLFMARSKGAPIKAFMQIHKDADFVVLLTLEESEITSLEQLQNKKVGFFYGHISTDILRILFKKENIEIEEVDVGFDYGQLLTGQLAAQWAFRTTAAISLHERGIKLKVIKPSDYEVKTQGHVIVASEELMVNDSDLVQKFTNAVLGAIKICLDNPDAAVQAAIKRDPNISVKIGQRQIDIYNQTIQNNKNIGWISLEDMEQTKAQMLSADLISPDFDVQASFDLKFLKTNQGDESK